MNRETNEKGDSQQHQYNHLHIYTSFMSVAYTYTFQKEEFHENAVSLTSGYELS